MEMNNQIDSEFGIVLNEFVINNHNNHDIERKERTISTSSSVATVSLPINADRFETNETLLSVIRKNRNGFRLLIVCGNYWPETLWKDCDYKEILLKLYYISQRCFLVAMFLVYIITLLTSNINSAFTVLSMITIIIDTIAVFPAQFINQCRLRESARIQDATVIDESTRIATYFLAFSLTATVLFIINFAVLNPVNQFSALLLFVLFIGELALSGYLTFNLLLLLTDLKVASLFLDQLFLFANNKTLTLDKFTAVRQDIHRRVSISKYATDVIIVPCLCSSIVLAVVLQTKDLRAYNVALLLLKEICFVAIAFWYVAKVNEKADVLTRTLSAKRWDIPTLVDQHTDISRTISSSSITTSTTSLDIERLSICSTCIVEPISVTLLFKRLSVQNVAVSFVGFIASLLAGIIKHLVVGL